MVHGANMGPTLVLSSPGGPHVGTINLAIRALSKVTTAIKQTRMPAPNYMCMRLHNTGYFVVINLHHYIILDPRQGKKSLQNVIFKVPIWTKAYKAFYTLWPRQNGWQFPDNILKCIFLTENIWISIKISLKFLPKGPFINTTTFVQVMAWQWPGTMPLSEPMMVSLLSHHSASLS